MAAAVASQTIVDGPTHVALKLTNISDGTGESAVVKVDVSALNARADGTACSGVTIDKVHHSVTGFTQPPLLDLREFATPYL